MARAQVTIFVILSLLLIVTLMLMGTLLILSQSDLKEDLTTPILLEFMPPQRYVEYCVQSSLAEVLHEVLPLLGYEQSITYRGENFPLRFTPERGTYFQTYSHVQNLIDERFPLHLGNCINTTAYEEMGYIAEFGPKETSTTITRHRTTVTLSMFTNVDTGNAVFTHDQFLVEIPISLGYVFDTITHAINTEIEQQFFDHVAYMHLPENDGPYLRIQKFKPYPAILYNISFSYWLNDYSLLFSILTPDPFDFGTVDLSKITFPTSCCYDVRNMCHKGVSQEQCVSQGGFYEAIATYGVIFDTVEPLEFAPCLGSPSGSSYCEFDPGVGGRFFRTYCFDGEWITESCRDFKQEVCVRHEQGQTQCRINTAQMCHICEDQECCELYDCVYSNNICTPIVDLGIPFWEFQIAQPYCNLHTECVGDCGEAQSFLGGFGMNYQDITRLQWESHPITSIEEVEPLTVAQILNQGLLQLEILSQNIHESFLDPLQPTTTIIPNPGSFCPVFTPLPEQLCEFCGNFGKPCTEYACRSLGTQCVFSSDTTSCTLITPDDLHLDITSEYEPHTILNLLGFKLSEDISTQRPFTINFQTSNPARCKPSYLPNREFGVIRSPDLSANQYSTNHSLTLRFVNDLPMLPELLESFEVETYSELIRQIMEFTYRIRQLQQLYPYIERFRFGFIEDLDIFVSHYVDPQNQIIIDQIVDQIPDKRFTAFITCQTATGITNNSFFSFSLNNTCMDLEILHNVTQANAVSLFLSHPTQCESESGVVFTCAQSQYELSSIFPGTYSCRGILPRGTTQETITCEEIQFCGEPTITIETDPDTGDEIEIITEPPKTTTQITIQFESFEVTVTDNTISVSGISEQECTISRTGETLDFTNSITLAQNWDRRVYTIRCGSFEHVGFFEYKNLPSE